MGCELQSVYIIKTRVSALTQHYCLFPFVQVEKHPLETKIHVHAMRLYSAYPLGNITIANLISDLGWILFLNYLFYLKFPVKDQIAN